MGGYLSAPPSLAAKIKGIPIVLHEQNSVPGLANRIVSGMAHRTAVSFPQSQPFFDKEVRITGNPVREELKNLPKASEARHHFGLDEDKFTFLIFGGSQGAHWINFQALESFQSWGSEKKAIQVLHLTGPKDEENIKEGYQSIGLRAVVLPYCHEMEKAYAASDFVVSRAGAGTIAELLVVHKPALLIPYPSATANHQKINGKFLEDLGAAQLFEQTELSELKLMELMKIYAQNPGLLNKMRGSYAKNTFDPLRAAEAIESIILEFSKS